MILQFCTFQWRSLVALWVLIHLERHCGQSKSIDVFRAVLSGIHLSKFHLKQRPEGAFNLFYKNRLFRLQKKPSSFNLDLLKKKKRSNFG